MTDCRRAVIVITTKRTEGKSDDQSKIFKKNSIVPENIEKQVPRGGSYKIGKLTFLETSIVIFHNKGIYIRPLFRNRGGVMLLENAENILIVGQNGGVKINTKPLFSIK